MFRCAVRLQAREVTCRAVRLGTGVTLDYVENILLYGAGGNGGVASGDGEDGNAMPAGPTPARAAEAAPRTAAITTATAVAHQPGDDDQEPRRDAGRRGAYVVYVVVAVLVGLLVLAYLGLLLCGP